MKSKKKRASASSEINDLKCRNLKRTLKELTSVGNEQTGEMERKKDFKI